MPWLEKSYEKMVVVKFWPLNSLFLRRLLQPECVLFVWGHHLVQLAGKEFGSCAEMAEAKNAKLVSFFV